MRRVRDRGEATTLAQPGTGYTDAMPETDLLLLLLLIATAIVLVLLVVLLLRRPESALETLRGRIEEALREEQRGGRAELRQQLDSLALAQGQRIEAFGRNLGDLTARTDARLDELRAALIEDARTARLELGAGQQQFAEGLGARLRELADRNELRLGELRATLEQKLGELQRGNEAKLEQMRATVDEKLQSTLETRLTESFGNVAQMLAQVHQGLGDMNKLAADVGGLQRVLSNVKSRGVFGEVQLAALLEQVFAPDQYAANVKTVPGRNESVEFAVRFPGSEGDAPVWLPIDAKFPREDYERLLEAHERSDAPAMEVAAKAIEVRLRAEARRIREKYVAPPHTTDFAILFLPTEGLYAEGLRRPGLVEALQREHKVMLAGPTTLLATLNSLQMGFRTLALEKRSAEVWEVLGAVKTEFMKFGEVLAKTKKKLDEAGSAIEAAEVRTRAMARQLRTVEALPEPRAAELLPGGAAAAEEDDVRS